MVTQRHCPFCGAASDPGCVHLALAVPGRDFVQQCVRLCHGQKQWQVFCRQAHDRAGGWSPDNEDFTWLETAFCERFLKHLRWFSGIEYEWRTGPKLDRGGFWVLLWSRDPRRLWWELLDEFDRQLHAIKPIAARAAQQPLRGFTLPVSRNVP